MKLTKSKLKQLIKEELKSIMNEQEDPSPSKQLNDALEALKNIGNFQTTYAVALYNALKDKDRLDVFEKLKAIPMSNQKKRIKVIKDVFPGYKDAIMVRGISSGHPEPAKIRPSEKRVLVSNAVINIPGDNKVDKERGLKNQFLSPAEMEAKSEEIDKAHAMFKPAMKAYMAQPLSAADVRYGRRFRGDRGSLGS